MATGTTLESSVRALLDRQSISDCVARYSRGMDRLDRELVLGAYHDDAIDDHGKFIGGPKEFIDWSFAMHREHHHAQQHAVLNQTCDLDGDVAHAETYFIFTAMNKTGPPWSMSGGRYLDRFERRDGRWAIAHRVCIRDWAATDHAFDPDDPTTLTATQASLSPSIRKFFRTAAAPRRDHLDPSYARPLVADTARLDAWVQLRGATSAEKEETP